MYYKDVIKHQHVIEKATATTSMLNLKTLVLSVFVIHIIRTESKTNMSQEKLQLLLQSWNLKTLVFFLYDLREC